MVTRGITLRSEYGYSATNYDASAAETPKTLRCQFGSFYDVKKVRNTRMKTGSNAIIRFGDRTTYFRRRYALRGVSGVALL